MKALTVIPLKAGSAELDRRRPSRPSPTARCWSRPSPSASAAPTLEIISGAYGGRRPGRDAPGPRARVPRPGARGAGRRRPSAKGDLVVGIVRRPDPVPCTNCAVRRVGLLPQRAVHRARHQGARRLLLRALPHHPRLRGQGRPGLGLLGVLLEPTSVVAKAWEQVDRIGGRAHWEPADRAGHRRRPIGLLAALIGVQRGLDVHVIDQVTDGRQARPGRATSAPRTTPARIERRLSRPDIVIECTGVASLVLRRHGRTSGPAAWSCLTGVSSGGHTIDVDEGNAQPVDGPRERGGRRLGQRQPPPLRGAAAALAKADRSWLERLVSRKVPLEQWQEALDAPARRRQGRHRGRRAVTSTRRSHRTVAIAPSRRGPHVHDRTGEPSRRPAPRRSPPGVLEIDTLLGGWERVTAGYLIEGPAPVLVETGSQTSVPVLLAALEPDRGRRRRSWPAWR